MQVRKLIDRFNSLSERQRFALLSLLCFLILVLRLRKRFIFPHLWAEDGTPFLSEALSQGFDSLLNPYGGYFHSVSRLIAILGVSIVDLTWYPIYTMLVCLVFTSLIFATITRSTYDWLLPQYGLRIAVAVLFCLVPGSSEVFGNPTNFHWILYVYLWLLTLKAPFHKHNVWELFFIIMCVLSMGESIVLVPLVVWRLFQQWKVSKKFNRASISDWFFLIAILGTAALNFYIRQSQPKEAMGSLGAIFECAIVTIAQNFFYLPLLGPELYIQVAPLMEKSFHQGLGVAVVVFALIWIYRKRGAAGMTFVLALLCAFGLPLLTFFVRPGSVGWLGRLVLEYGSEFGHRYYFLLAPMAVMLWAMVMSVLKQSFPWGKNVAFVLGIMIFQGGIPYIKVKAFGKDLVWREDVKRLKSSIETGCPQHVVVPIYPKGWQVSYHSNKVALCP